MICCRERDIYFRIKEDCLDSATVPAGPERLELASSSDEDEEEEDATFLPRTQASSPSSEQADTLQDVNENLASEREAEAEGTANDGAVPSQDDFVV